MYWFSGTLSIGVLGLAIGSGPKTHVLDRVSCIRPKNKLDDGEGDIWSLPAYGAEPAKIPRLFKSGNEADFLGNERNSLLARNLKPSPMQ